MYFIETIVLNFLLFTLVQSNAAELCNTTNNESGKCISILSCPKLFEMIKDETTSSIKLIRKSICGFEGTDSKVCCISQLNSTKPVEKNERKTNNRQLLASRKYCGFQHSDDYEHNSNGTIITEFPWLARIVFGYSDESPHSYVKKYRGLGSLLNTRYILTAVTCVVSPRFIPMEVQLGEYHIANDTDCVIELRNLEECSDPTRLYGIEKIITHLNYSESTDANDIALIRLNKTVMYSDYVRPICLPYPGTRFANVGNTLTTSGWGFQNIKLDEAVIKKKVLGALISLAECKEAYENVSSTTLTEKQICTVTYENSTEFSCSGDSGAPVIFSHKLQWHQEGIVSFGVGICGSVFPEVHTKVHAYLDWIEENIEP